MSAKPVVVSEAPAGDRPTAPPEQVQHFWVEGEGLEPGDAYQEGPYVVFTAQFHLRRGYCCNSGCRHCPYR